MGEGAGTLWGPGTATAPPEPVYSHPGHGHQGTNPDQSCKKPASGGFPPASWRRGPMAVRAARATLSALQPSPPQAPSLILLLLPSSSQGHLPCSIVVRAASGARRIPCPPTPCSSIPRRGTYMAHCSFSFLMEPYSACREKSGGSAGQRCQAGGLLQGTEEAHQTGSGSPEVKATPCQFVPAQLCPG